MFGYDASKPEGEDKLLFDVDEAPLPCKLLPKDMNLTVDEVTIAKPCALKSVKCKANVVEEPCVPVSVAKVQDKGKGIMVEPEKPLKKKDQISFDEQEAICLQVTD
ncbi:hypothetical protein Tco_0574421 [Tanacetum coccineum]